MLFKRKGKMKLEVFIEFIRELSERLSEFKDIIAASALIIIDICALVIMAFCIKEKKAVQAQWGRAARHMTLTDSAESFYFTLNSQEILLGRHISTDLRISDMSVSRYHALLTLENGVWTIKDLNSTTGTFVNGIKVTEKKLRNNDEIKIGKKIMYIRRMKPQNV